MSEGMGYRWARILIAALAAEIGAIGLLVVCVFLFGPGTPVEDQIFAERTGLWLGPSSGVLTTFVAGWWASRREPAAASGIGLSVGACTAALDVMLLAVAGTPFAWLFVLSNAGRILAGTAGGAAVARSPRFVPGTRT